MQAVLQTAVPPLHPLDSIIKCSKQTNKNTCKDTSCTGCSPLQVSVRIADRSPRESRVWSRTESPQDCGPQIGDRRPPGSAVLGQVRERGQRERERVATRIVP